MLVQTFDVLVRIADPDTFFQFEAIPLRQSQVVRGLFVPQCNHRINFGGPQRGDIACDESDRQQQ